MTLSLEKLGTFELVDFIELTTEEKEVILEWRNHTEIKKWMYNQDDIILVNHLSFIESLQKSSNKKYFLVKNDNKKIGVIDFINIDYIKKECEFGLYANPFEKIIGIGRILEELCIKYAFEVLNLNKLKLEVYAENVKAINLYEIYKFKEVGIKKVSEKNVICMELRR